MYPQLNLPHINLKLKDQKIWDVLRQKYVKHTPEEWVRQHMIHFLIQKGYSKNLMQSEQIVTYNNLKKRCDIVVFNNKLQPIIIVECKAPKIKISSDTFYQIAKYHSKLKAPFLILTNGLHHIHALLNKNNSEIVFLQELPSKDELLKTIA